MAQQGCSLSTLQIKQRFKHKIFASECTFGLYHCHISKKQIHPSENTTVLCIKEKQKKKQRICKQFFKSLQKQIWQGQRRNVLCIVWAQPFWR